MKSKQFEIKTQCQYVCQSKLMCQLAIDSFNVINVINEDRQLHKYHDSFNVINDCGNKASANKHTQHASMPFRPHASKHL